MIFADRFISSPTQVSGCMLWLDASDASTITQNATGSVSQWRDKSGLNHHFGQDDNTLRPTFQATGFNHKPCVVGDGTNDYLLNSSSLAQDLVGGNDKPFTLFFVAELQAGGNQVIAGFGNSSTTANAWVNLTTGGNEVIKRDDGANIVNASTGFGTTSIGRHMVRVTSKGTSVQFVLDRIRVNATNPWNVNSTTLNRATLFGVMTAGAIAINSSFKIAEFVAFNRELSIAEAEMVEKHLSKKWGMYPDRELTAPTDLSNCSLWWDSSAVSTVTADATGSVSQWTDKVRSVVMGQSNNLKRPKLNPSSQDFNGMPALEFKGAANDIWMSSSAFTAVAQPLTIVVAGKHDSISAPHVIWEYNSTSSDRIQFKTNVNPNRYTMFAGQPTLVGPTRDPSSKFVASTVANGAQSTIRENGTTLVRGRTGAQGINSVSIGSLVDGASTSIVGSIVEVIVFSRALSDAELALIENYIYKKWSFWA